MSDTDDDSQGSDIRNNVVFPKKLLKKFIMRYKELPCLWDRNCPAYKQKLKRHEAITRLTELVQQHDPTATRVHVLRKIESLRACVRREHKRVRASQINAQRPEDLYEPHLWYYNLLSFVFEDDGDADAWKNNSSLKIEERMHSMQNEEDNMVLSTFEAEPPPFEQSLDADDYSVASSLVEVSDNHKCYEDEPSAKRLCTEVADEYDAIGVNVAAKLRNLPSNMRILAEKLINDVLFQAQLNGLSSSSVISTPTDPFKTEVP